MFRDKEFLIEHGLSKGTRKDTCYILGSIYDAIVDNNYVYDNNISNIYKEKEDYIRNHPDEFSTYNRVVRENTILEKCQFELFKDVNFKINMTLEDRYTGNKRDIVTY